MKDENIPDNWSDAQSEELRQAVFDALFDMDPVNGRKFPDPVEPWESWEVTSADKNLSSDKIVVILEHGDYTAVFTAIKVHDLWDSRIAFHYMQGQA